MEEPKRTWNDQEKKKMVIKIGGGGGGIGAVVLLGGALATAALASAFIVRKKGRSSGKDRRHQSPPPEINKKSEQDEANKGQQFVVLDQPSDGDKYISSGATKEVESDNDTGPMVSTESFTLDEKIPRGENVKVSDEQILSKKLENDVISDGFVIIEEGSSLLDKKLPSEPGNMMHEDEVKFELIKEDAYDEIPKESRNLEQVYVEEERAEKDGEIEGTSHEEAVVITEIKPRQEENTEVGYDQKEIEVTIVDIEGVHNGEISEEKCQEAIEKTEDDLAVIANSSLSETIVSESYSLDGQKTLDSPVIEHEKVNGDEKEGILPSEIVGKNQEDEANEGSQEEEVKYIDVQFVKEPEKNDQVEGIVPEKCEANQSNPQSLELKADFEPKDQENDVGRLIGKEVEDSSEKINTGIAIAKTDLIKKMTGDEEKGENIRNLDYETDLSDEVEESSVETGDSSVESNWEAVWPAELMQDSAMEPQRVKPVDQEVEGKVQEDRVVKESEHNSQNKKIIGEKPHQVKAKENNSKKSSENFPTVANISKYSEGEGNSEKAFIKKYVAELAMIKDHPANSTKLSMLIGILSVLASFSCSWFFGLSYVKLCLIVFLAMVLSKIHGY